MTNSPVRITAFLSAVIAATALVGCGDELTAADGAAPAQFAS
jgi:hypothetical protein